MAKEKPCTERNGQDETGDSFVATTKINLL
jgi:hypothetical protein